MSPTGSIEKSHNEKDGLGVSACLWSHVVEASDPLSDAALRSLCISGESDAILPSVYNVTAYAAACVGVAGLAAAKVKALRSGREAADFPRVEVQAREACAAFQCESLLQGCGWKLPALWDPIAGNYRAGSRWIRLHTNYAHHRRAVLGALGLLPASTDSAAACDRSAVQDAVRNWDAVALETEVIARGGAAAVMHTRAEWLAGPFGATGADGGSGASTASEPPLVWAPSSGGHGTHVPVSFGALGKHDAPLAGIRVLDLTRVIAGPDCTRFLASQGACVLRIDPPGFEEVPALVVDTTVGKRCAALDLRTPEGRETFLALVREAHVLVSGYRPGVLEALGLSPEVLRAQNPSLILASVNAYGTSSPWATRRGFDSLVQMSVGIAAAGRRMAHDDRMSLDAANDAPVPLPVQALDHGAGHLLAAGVCEALARLWQKRGPSQVSCSLVGAAEALLAGPSGSPFAPPIAPEFYASCLKEEASAWGPLLRVAPGVLIDGTRGAYSHTAGPLGRHDPRFL